MTRHSTNDTELFRKMTSLILMGKISPPGHCHKETLDIFVDAVSVLSG